MLVAPCTLTPNGYDGAPDQPGEVREDKPAGMSLLCWGILSLPNFLIGLQLRKLEHICHVLHEEKWVGTSLNA